MNCMNGSFAGFSGNENGYGKLATELLYVPAQAYGLSTMVSFMHVCINYASTPRLDGP